MLRDRSQFEETLRNEQKIFQETILKEKDKLIEVGKQNKKENINLKFHFIRSFFSDNRKKMN